MFLIYYSFYYLCYMRQKCITCMQFVSYFRMFYAGSANKEIMRLNKCLWSAGCRLDISKCIIIKSVIIVFTLTFVIPWPEQSRLFSTLTIKL